VKFNKGENILEERAKCIFCLKEIEKGSDEHIFPDALGGLLIIKEVCKPCNDFLGQKVDSHLVNHFLMQLARLVYKLQGKKGKIPNPIGKGVLKDEPNTEIHYILDDEGQPKSLYIVPQKHESPDGSKVMFVVDSSDKGKLVKMVNKTLERKGLPPMTEEEILSKAVYKKDENPTVMMNIEVDFLSYKKAILKIIYEITYYCLGPEYLNDPVGKQIRDCILSDSIEECKGLMGKIDLVDKSNPSNQILRKLASEDSHIAILINNGCRGIFCYVNIFDTFEGGLLVSENGENYPGITDVFIKNDIKNNNIIESTLTKEIIRSFDDNGANL
jgi:HNH endonuclease